MKSALTKLTPACLPSCVRCWATRPQTTSRIRGNGTRASWHFPVAINDSWIVATAIAHGLPLVTQDRDYTTVPGLTVVTL